MSDTAKTRFADLLNSLVEMQASPSYAVRRSVLASAESAIVGLERELAEAREQINVLKGGVVDLTVAHDEQAAYAVPLREFAERIEANAKTLANDKEQPESSRRMWTLCYEDARDTLAALAANPEGAFRTGSSISGGGATPEEPRALPSKDGDAGLAAGPVRQANPSDREPSDEREACRAEQARRVMPLIGPLLDAWDGLIEQPDELGPHIAALNAAMELDGYEPPTVPSQGRVFITDNDRSGYCANCGQHRCEHDGTACPEIGTSEKCAMLDAAPQSPHTNFSESNPAGPLHGSATATGTNNGAGLEIPRAPGSVGLDPPHARGGGQETHTCQRCGTVKPKGEPCIHFDEGARAANRGGLG